MVYVLSKASIDRVRPQLCQLDGSLQRFYSGNPQKLAYSLRQGIAAAIATGDPDAPRHAYTFSVAEGFVLAVPREYAPVGPTRSEPTNVVQLLQSLMTESIAEPTRFPNLTLTDDDRDNIAPWLSKHELSITITDGEVVIGRVAKSSS